MATRPKEKEKKKPQPTPANLFRLLKELKKEHRSLRESFEAMQKREKKREHEVAQLREELMASETRLLAAELRELNERRSREGVSSVKATLKLLRERGIVDEKGRRISNDLPAKMTQSRSSVV